MAGDRPIIPDNLPFSKNVIEFSFVEVRHTISECLKDKIYRPPINHVISSIKEWHPECW